MRQLGLEDTEGMPSVADFPARIQEYAVTHSLRRSSEEMALQKATEDLPMAMMAGAPDEANFLCLLLELLDAKIVVEVGVFRGLTTLCLAQCLQKLATAATDHRVVIGLDVSEDYAAVGKEHWKLAGVEDYIDFRVGDAKESLSRLLESEDYGPSSVDLCFIDADKTSYDDYYEKCLKLTRPGGLIVVDNTIWSGNVAIPDLAFEKAAEMLLGDDAEQAELLARVQDAVAIKAINEKIHKDERIERVCFLTIADGVTVCRKK
jgi:predicted O-methyltransferase YrrM